MESTAKQLSNPDSSVEDGFLNLSESLSQDAQYLGGQVARLALDGNTESAHAVVELIDGLRHIKADVDALWERWGVWNAFAETLRANAKKLGEMRSSMMPQAGAGQQKAPTIIERVESQERWMQARLDGTRTMKTALSKLYETLSDDQKKSANELLAPHMGMGMMTMMRAQMQPGQMRPGQMGPDPH